MRAFTPILATLLTICGAPIANAQFNGADALPRPGAQFQILKQRTAHTEQAVTVRSGPGVAFPMVWILQPGTTVGVGDCVASTWCQVSGAQGSGWIAAAYLVFGG